ncbi:MAG TPA: hypothetical protein DD381_09545 [Lentisphaeria bacterium]|nr:MAG: hypothetical protein A2X47_07420 [Lentisphaerae bacterium GWF2_38_69]HBM16567.1 hypothetical protein [Lentisphaeria bacterium]
MDRIDIISVSSELRTAYKKAVQAIDKNNAEYAVTILKDILSAEPGFIQAREKLRIAEKIMQGNSNILKKAMDILKVKKIVKTAQIDFMRGKYTDAMAKAEEALAIDVKNWEALNLLANCAAELKIEFIVTETYEFAYSLYPDNKEVINTLASHYRKLSRGKDEFKLRQKLVDMFPDNLEYKQELRSAGAMATMERDGDEKVGSYRDKLKDSKEAAILEQQEKQIHNVDDVKDLLESLKDKLKINPDSIPIIRELAWAYYRGDSLEEAIRYFHMLEEKQEHFDLASNKALEYSIFSLNKKKIDDLNKESEKTDDFQKKNTIQAKIDSINNSNSEMKKNFALTRIEVYPNDLQLKYELALIYWETRELDHAIEQFQLAQKHPKYNFSSNVFLGKCFYEKGHNELAIDQLGKVIKMENYEDKELLESIYYLGLAFEKANDSSNAKECFKKVYSVSSKYKDISDKIQKYFSHK